MESNEPPTIFEWDEAKNLTNQAKHALTNPQRIIYADLDHSINEDQLFCLGIAGGGVMTVRFTYRDNCIRIFGAGYSSSGKRIYDNGRHSLH